MAGKVYFGTIDKQMWIKAPTSGMKASSIGWSSETQLLNGRAFVRRSKASHRRFDATWVGDFNSSDLEKSLQTIKSYSDGLYGNGPFYWLDPFAINQNLMPEFWAAPMLGETDWPKLTSDITPSFDISGTANNFPIKYAEYITTNNYEGTKKLVIIIPSGYKLHFGWHGTAASSTKGIRITPYLRSTGAADTAINPDKLTAGGTVRTNTQISGTTYSYVEIQLATTTASTVQIVGMIAQVLISTASPASGGFIPGKGTTGLEFAQAPTIDYYSSPINNGQIGMAASWVEV